MPAREPSPSGASAPPRLRVLALAEAANPDWTSVPLVGWSHARALARHADVHLVTQVRNAAAIEAAGLVPGEDFTAIDTEPVARPMWQASRLIQKLTGLGWTLKTAMATVGYYYFERLVWDRFGDALRRGEYDVVHRITPVSPTIQSTLAGRLKKIGVPFVWGPINGGFPYPPGFRHLLRTEGEWLSHVRRLYAVLPGYRDARKNASALVVASEATMAQMPTWARDRCVYLPENAIDPDRFQAPPERPVGLPLRLAFVGRLVPLKSVDAAIEAAAPLLRDGRARFEIFGDGPERARLEAQAAELGVADAVSFAGWVDHRELGQRLGASNVFVFPSVREFGGGVVLEAMTLGLVPVIADYAGPKDLVPDGHGFRVSVDGRDALVSGLREVLEDLAADPSQIPAIGARARDQVQRLHTWDARALQMVEIFRWVLGRRGKPDFGQPISRAAAEA